MVIQPHLTAEEKSAAAKKLEYRLDLQNDPDGVQDLRRMIERYFPGCESLYISMSSGEVEEHAELEDGKIPGFVIDMLGIELLEGEHGRMLRKMLLAKLLKRNPRQIEDLGGDPNVQAHDADAVMCEAERLANKKWAPGSKWARRFVTKFGFHAKFAGMRSPGKPESVEWAEKRAHLGPLKDFQNNLKSQIGEVLRRSNSRDNRCILRLPTGAGKTRIAAEGIINYWRSKPDGVKWIMWIANTEELCEQAIQCFRQMWEEFGEEDVRLGLHRVWDGRPIPDPAYDGIIIAGISQLLSLSRYSDPEREDEVSRVSDGLGLVVIDEAHHATARSYGTVLKSLEITRYPDGSDQVPLIGLTATPFRTSEEETERLRRMFGGKILHPDPSFPHGRQVLREMERLGLCSRTAH